MSWCISLAKSVSLSLLHLALSYDIFLEPLMYTDKILSPGRRAGRRREGAAIFTQRLARIGLVALAHAYDVRVPERSCQTSPRQ